MARGKLGSYVGSVSANVDLIPDLAVGRSSSPKATDFVIRKIAIYGPENLAFRMNGERFVLTDSGILETSEDQIDIKSLIFESGASVNIRFLY